MKETPTTTNYAAHALDALKQIERAMPREARNSKGDLDVLRNLIRKSEKFLLPPNGVFLSTVEYQEHFFDLLRLPYPIVALEIPVTQSDVLANSAVSKSLLIAWSKDAGCPWRSVVSDDDAINFTEMVFWAGEWRLRPGVCGFSPANLDFHGGKSVACSGNPLFQEYFDECPLVDIETEIGCMFSSGFNALVEFCLTVNCENVLQEKIEPSRVLNQSRARKGKTPFYSYHFLTIPSPATESKASSAGHSSPRVHLRRGHLRRLSGGRVTWVRNTIVGNPDLGVVEKTYLVR